MIENEIYYYINGFLKWINSYIVGNKKYTGQISVFKLRNKRKSIFARVIIRYYGSKKITKETGKIIVESTYKRNNRTKFRKRITRGKLVHFRSIIDTSRSKTRRIQFIIFTFVKKGFYFNLSK